MIYILGSLKMQLKTVSLLLSVVGITLLYFLSTLSQPVVVELHEIPDFEDKQVTVEGIVKEHYTTSYGSQMITILGDNTTIVIFSEEQTDIEYGDKIQATGKVQRYNDDWEVVVGDKRLISIVQKWQNISMPLWQIAENPTKYEGLNVNVTGFVDAVYDDYFYLVDAEASHSIIAFYGSSDDITLYSGEKVNVAAQFNYDAEHARYKLELLDEMHGISLSLEG